MDHKEERLFKVSSTTNVIKLSDAISAALDRGDIIKIASAGSWANSQMTKALAVTRRKLLGKGLSLAWYSTFKSDTGLKSSTEFTVIITTLFLQ